MGKHLNLCRIAIGALFVFASSLCWGTTFLQTLAWQRLFNTVSYDDRGKIDVDAGGNIYLWYQATEGTEQFRLSRLSPAGNVYLSAYQTFDKNSENVGVLAAPDGYIYTGVVNVQGNTPSYSRITKYGAGLNVIWTHDFQAPNTQMVLSAFDVDKYGTVYAVLQSYPTNGTYQMLFKRLSSANVEQAQTGIATDMIPEWGFAHVAGNWILAGYDPLTSGVKWGYYDDVTGATFGGDSDPNSNDIPGIANYYVLTPVPNSTDVIVARNTMSNDGFTTTNSYRVTYRHITGVNAWQTATGDGLVQNIQCLGAGSNVYLNTRDHLQMLNSQGVSQWNKPFVCDTFFLDATGFYSFHSLSSSNAVNYSRYDLLADDPPQWTTNVGGTSATLYSGFASAVARNSTLCVAASVGDNNTGYDIDVRRFVTGTALSSIASNKGAASLHSSGSLVLKVSLNQPAGKGGILINLTSANSKLLFANNTTAMSLAIPNGSLYALVTLHAGVVTQNTSAVVTGTSNGIARSVTVSILP
jgi:hypothetical protein